MPGPSVLKLHYREDKRLRGEGGVLETEEKHSPPPTRQWRREAHSSMARKLQKNSQMVICREPPVFLSDRCCH